MHTTEEYLKRILKVLVFIEDHIDEEMTLQQLATVACYSPFHFHRLFQGIVGETVHQYIKRLRLEKAARKLRKTDLSVTEIALDANYDTPSAFTKAFKQQMGKTPRSYRELDTAIDMMAKKIKELPMIKPDKIEKISDLPLLFIRRYGNYTKTPWDAWKAMGDFLNENHIDRSKLRYFGILQDDPTVTDENKVRYDACILAPSGVKEKAEVGKETLKGGKYAVFTYLGAYDKLEQTFINIYLKWLPESKEELDEERAPFCEHFHMEYIRTDPTKLVTKIYIPLA
jgi:AraC family transcriptional regulator